MEMDDADIDTFDRGFRRMASVFRLRLKEPEMKELIGTYFRVLKSARLDAVLAAAKVCLATCKAFPKPVEWLDAIPKTPRMNPASSALREMSTEEAAEWSRADRLRYQDAACSCGLCDAAAVTDRPLRFVPNFSADDRADYVRHPDRQQPVVSGHWAHGDELARWYVARNAFFALGPTLKPHVRALLPVILREREPSEEG